jgi:hypothetical protein
MLCVFATLFVTDLVAGNARGAADAEPRGTVEIFVASSGTDTATGLGRMPGPSGPLRTLPRALARLRELRSTGQHESYSIKLLAGRYFLQQTLNIGADDSGTPSFPLLIEGVNRNTVILTGARPLQRTEEVVGNELLARVPDVVRSHVVIYDLKKSGATDWVGPLEHPNNLPLAKFPFPSELFINDLPAPLARWPESGFAKLVEPKEPNDNRHFFTDPSIPSAWKIPLDVFASGYWGTDWSESYLHASVGDDGLVALLDQSPHYGIKSGQRVYLENFPEALSRPGEWFADAASSVVFLIPSDGQAQPIVELSVTPLLISLHSARNIVIRNLTLRDSRGDLVAGDDVDNVTLENVNLKYAGHTAVILMRAHNSGLRNCSVEGAGATGVHLQGGDRATLTPGGNYVTNSRITGFARRYRTGEPGVLLEGVGNRVEHSEIANSPHVGIWFDGNNHQIRNNDIHHVGQETGDVGAVYTGRDWTARGSMIEHNYFHDIQGVGTEGATGVYLDDQASGIAIRGNLFVRVFRGVLIGGGSDNEVSGNLFVNTGSGIHLDGRGMTWERALSKDPKGTLQTRLRAVPYDSPAYVAAYPTLSHVLLDGPGIPRRNLIRANLAVPGEITDFQLDATTLALQSIDRNWSVSDATTLWKQPPDLAGAAAAHDFTLDADSKWLQEGFQSPDVATAGPQ